MNLFFLKEDGTQNEKVASAIWGFVCIYMCVCIPYFKKKITVF